MTLTSLGALLVVWCAAIATPGPDLLQIIRTGTKNRSAGVFCALGVMSALTIWITASLLGLSALMAANPLILHLIQLVGGLYIAWMGFGAARSGAARLRNKSEQPEHLDVVDVGKQKAYLLGLWTNLSNPKAVIFFGAIFSQFVWPDASLWWNLVIAAVLIATGLIWFIGFAVAVRTMSRAIVKNGALIDLIAGLIFIAIACVMIYEGIGGVI